MIYKKLLEKRQQKKSGKKRRGGFGLQYDSPPRLPVLRQLGKARSNHPLGGLLTRKRQGFIP